MEQLEIFANHVYFDNNAHGHSPHNAVRLLELLQQLSTTR